MTDDRRSIAWVCAHYADRVETLLAALDPARVPPDGDAVARCERLLAACREADCGAWLRHPAPPAGDACEDAADQLAAGIFPVPGGHAAIPERADGSLDWGHIPPGPGGVEWVYGINRHDYLADLLAAFRRTGNRRYVAAMDRQLHDWAAKVTAPETPGRDCPWGTILEAGHRVKAWPAVLYGLIDEPAFADATRLLLVVQCYEHACFLRQHHSAGSNWVITEMAGLLSVAAALPMLREAAAWRTYALELVARELRDQVYPDGIQKELACNYQLAVLDHMRHVVDTARGAQLAMPDGLMALLEDMWSYLAYSLDSRGHAPHNGDSDRATSASSQIIRPLIAGPAVRWAAAVWERPDWTWIATAGTAGVCPPGPPSVGYPWGGQLIMRSDWGPDAQWAYFDAGPWGVLHQQNDALHLSISAHGRDLLVDAGRYTYDEYWGPPGSWRSYFIGSAAHNVILLDGLHQANGPREVSAPLPDWQLQVHDAIDFAQATYDTGFADVATTCERHRQAVWKQPVTTDGVVPGAHTRAVLYLRGACWLVVDHISTDRPRTIQPLWHFHPDCQVTRDGQSVLTTDPGVGNLRIQPIADVAWDIELVSGREGADCQGWYSPEMDVRLPATCACYAAAGDAITTVAWLIQTATGHVAPAQLMRHPSPAGSIHLDVTLATGQQHEIAVRIAGDDTLTLHDGTPLVGPYAVRPLSQSSDS